MTLFQSLLYAWFATVGAFGLLGCNPEPGSDQSKTSAERRLTPETISYTEKGDLSQLLQRGMIRILMPPQGEANHLPRQGLPLILEEELVVSFGEFIGVQPTLVRVKDHKDLIPLLLEGKGDLIAANFTVTPKRKEHIAFSVPVAVVREQAITQAKDGNLSKPADLPGRTMVVRRSSSFWETATKLQQQYPGLKLQAAPEHMDTLEILHHVADGKFDVTLADSNTMSAILTYDSALRVAFDLTKDRPIAWGIRPDSPKLLDATNRFLNEAKLAQQRPPVYKEDLSGLKKHGVLRVLTRNNPTTYFVWHGQLMGFEYELAKHFATSQGLRVEMIVPPSRENLIPWLLEGKGDLIAASLTSTKERLDQEMVFSRPYNLVSEILVARSEEPESRLERPSDLAGRTVAVRPSSAYWTTLEGIKKSGVPVKLVAVPETLETEDIIAQVASGEYDLTVADSHILDIELTWREDIRAAFPLGAPRPHGWAVRAKDTKLLAAINAYFQKEYRGLFYNLAYKKYFKNPRKILKHVEFRADHRGQLSPYDDLVRKYADQYGFDWRLIVAQMFQESRFDPHARSWAGAMGLMQVMPRTAQSLGFKDLSKPEEGIHAGIKYLEWVRKRFETELSVQDRTWLTLAGYNVGQGHVKDARRLAHQLGLNPNRWFGNVENAMLKLSRRQYARKARHGYCRGSEPVKYVREIKARYEAYLQMKES